MSDPIIVAIIAAVPSVLTFFLTAAIIIHAWRIPHKLEEIVQHTNGLTEKLLGQTAVASHAEGVQAEKARSEVAVDANAAIILAAAQLAADKILAAAKLAEERKEAIHDLGS